MEQCQPRSTCFRASEEQTGWESARSPLCLVWALAPRADFCLPQRLPVRTDVARYECFGDGEGLTGKQPSGSPHTRDGGQRYNWCSVSLKPVAISLIGQHRSTLFCMS